MNRAYLILASLVLSGTPPAFAAIEGERLADANAAAAPAASTVALTTEQRLERLEQELGDVRRERDIAIIHADLIDRQTSWFEILIGVLMGGFSLIVSGVVIFFTLRFGNTAVAEAKLAIAAEADEIRALVATAKAAVEDIHADRDKAHELLATISPSDVPKDKATRDSLRELAAAAASKPRPERTADDFRALINVAAIDEDWAAVERRAAAMFYLFEDDAEASAFALFAKGFAFGQLERSKEEMATYEDILARYGLSPDLALQEHVAKALINKGVRLRQLERAEDAIAAYDDILVRFGDSSSLVLQQYVAKALINKGVALRQLERSAEAMAAYDEVLDRFGNMPVPSLQEQVANALVNKGSVLVATGQYDEAIAVIDDVLFRFGSSPLPALQERVGTALFNKACCYGKWSQVAQCVDALARWRGHVGNLSCDKIAGDPDFDPVRADPQFIAFLADNGCVPPIAKPRPRRPRKPGKG